MGGQTGRDLAAVGLGLSEAFNERILGQLFERRAQEEESMRNVALSLAQSGQLHLQPEEITKGIQKRGGKDLFNTLNQLSVLKAIELEPRRQAQQDVLSQINAPIQTQAATPGGAVTVSPRSGQPQGAALSQLQPGQIPQFGAQGNLLGAPPLQAPAPAPVQPTVGQGQTAPTPQQVADPNFVGPPVRPIPHQTNPNPSGVTIPIPATRARERGATSFERLQRINNLSPLGVALAYGDNALGQLQLQTLQSQTAADRLLVNPSAPNPFAPATRISFVVPAAGRAVLAVFDPGGRHVRTLLDAPVPAGFRSVVWDGRNDTGETVAPGTYVASATRSWPSANARPASAWM